MFVDLTINIIVLRLLSLLIVVPVQRVVVAGTAVALGDSGPKYDGELKVDPLRHLDLFGSLSTIGFGIGWSRPVLVDPKLFRIGRFGVVVAIVAQFVALLLVAYVLSALVTPSITMLSFTAGTTVSAFLRAATEVALWFALLGLVPIPPLTGGLLLAAFGIRATRQVQLLLGAALLVAVATGVVNMLLGPTHAYLKSLVFSG